MVFRAERYPVDWKQIRGRIIERAGKCCECTGQCGSTHAEGKCLAPNGALIERSLVNGAVWREWCDRSSTGKPVRVVLTVAHLDHDESNNADGNLLAACQRCHLQIDRADNIRRRRRAAHARRAVRELPGL